VSEVIAVQSLPEEVYTVDKGTSCLSALKKMVAEPNYEDAVVVVDHTKSNVVIGLICDDDVLRWITEHGEKGLDCKVEEMMNDDPVTVTPDDTVETALQRMNERILDHILVVSKDKEYKGWVNRYTILNKLIPG